MHAMLQMKKLGWLSRRSGCSWLERLALMHPPDRHDKVWSLKDFYQLIKKGTLVTARLWLEVFFQNTLRIADCLESQFFVVHRAKLR